MRSRHGPSASDAHTRSPPLTAPPSRLQLLANQKEQIPEGQGIRLNGEKYMLTQTLKGQKYVAKIANAAGEIENHDVTVDEVHVMKKGSFGCMLGVKGGYYFAVRHDTKNPKT